MSDELHTYERDGYLLLPGFFSAGETRTLQAHAERVLGRESEARTLEKGTNVVRATHGDHRHDPFFRSLVGLSRLVRLAERLLGDQVYVHQFKINAKAALAGDVWEWHQDYRFWRDEDGMPAPDALTVGVLLDEVNEFNGPLMLVPGSHRDGLVAVRSEDSADWRDTLSADSKHRVDADTLRAVLRTRSIVAPKGAPGTALVFHSNILHGSVSNMSPDARRMLLISYNAVRNAPRPDAATRPEFLASRDFTPLVPHTNDVSPG